MVSTEIKLITFFVVEDGEAVYSQQKKKKKRPGTIVRVKDVLKLKLILPKMHDCGSDHELHIAKFRLKFEESRENHWPFSSDLNKIPNDIQ